MFGVIEFFTDLSLFHGVSYDELNSAEHYFEEVFIPKSAVLFSEGDDGNFMAFVMSGSLNVIKNNQQQEPKLLAQLGKGSVIGELSLVAKCPRSATITAVEQTQIIKLSRSSFDGLKREHPHVAVAILTHLSENLSKKLLAASRELADYIP